MKARKWRLPEGYFAALILAVAVEAGCDTLLTEGLQHGRKIRGLAIVDPFR